MENKEKQEMKALLLGKALSDAHPLITRGQIELIKQYMLELAIRVDELEKEKSKKIVL